MSMPSAFLGGCCIANLATSCCYQVASVQLITDDLSITKTTKSWQPIPAASPCLSGLLAGKTSAFALTSARRYRRLLRSSSSGLRLRLWKHLLSQQPERLLPCLWLLSDPGRLLRE